MHLGYSQSKSFKIYAERLTLRINPFTIENQSVSFKRGMSVKLQFLLKRLFLSRVIFSKNVNNGRQICNLNSRKTEDIFNIYTNEYITLGVGVTQVNKLYIQI